MSNEVPAPPPASDITRSSAACRAALLSAHRGGTTKDVSTAFSASSHIGSDQSEKNTAICGSRSSVNLKW